MTQRMWLQKAYARLAEAELTPSAKNILLLLLSLASDNGEVTITREEIGARLNVDVRTVYRSIQELRDLDYLADIQCEPGLISTYILHPKIVETGLLLPASTTSIPSGDYDGHQRASAPLDKDEPQPHKVQVAPLKEQEIAVTGQPIDKSRPHQIISRSRYIDKDRNW